MLSVAIAFICFIQNKSMLALYELLIHIYSRSKCLCVRNKMIYFSYKGGCVVHGLNTCIDVFERNVGLGYR